MVGLLGVGNFSCRITVRIYFLICEHLHSNLYDVCIANDIGGDDDDPPRS